MTLIDNDYSFSKDVVLLFEFNEKLRQQTEDLLEINNILKKVYEGFIDG